MVKRMAKGETKKTDKKEKSFSKRKVLVTWAIVT
jgi:hypothetical protein